MAKAKSKMKTKPKAKKAAPAKAKPAAKKAKPAKKAAKAKAPTKAKAAKKTAKPVAKAKTSAKKAAGQTKAKASFGQTATKTSTAKTSAPGAKSVKTTDFANFISPLDDRVLVQVSDLSRRTAGGLFIPDTVADTSGNVKGRIVALGRGHRDHKGRLRPLDVHLGDVVVFSQYAGDQIKILNQDLVLLRESEIMGVVTEG